MTATTLLRVVPGRLRTAVRTGVELCWRAVIPDVLYARRANAQVSEADATVVERRWEQSVASSGHPPPDSLSQVLQAQAERMRGSEAKAVASLQLTALLLAGWIFAANQANAWFKVLLIVGLAYLAASVWSALKVLQPSVRHVLGPTDYAGARASANAAVAYRLNEPTELRQANLVTAALRDAVRGAAVVGVAALASLLH